MVCDSNLTNIKFSYSNIKIRLQQINKNHHIFQQVVKISKNFDKRPHRITGDSGFFTGNSQCDMTLAPESDWRCFRGCAINSSLSISYPPVKVHYFHFFEGAPVFIEGEEGLCHGTMASPRLTGQ